MEHNNFYHSHCYLVYNILAIYIPFRFRSFALLSPFQMLIKSYFEHSSRSDARTIKIIFFFFLSLFFSIEKITKNELKPILCILQMHKRAPLIMYHLILNADKKKLELRLCEVVTECQQETHTQHNSNIRKRTLKSIYRNVHILLCSALFPFFFHCTARAAFRI